MAEQPLNFSLAESIKDGLREGIQRQKLDIPGVIFPEPPRTYFAKDVIGLRESLALSQAGFAALLHVPIGAIKAWEMGERKPSQAAARLLQLLEQPQLYSEYLAALKLGGAGQFALNSSPTNQTRPGEAMGKDSLLTENDIASLKAQGKFHDLGEAPKQRVSRTRRPAGRRSNLPQDRRESRFIGGGEGDMTEE